MDLGLKGKVALVTGAGSQIGFGKAIALTLAKEGCDVVVSDLHIDGAQKTADEIKALGRKSLAIKADITKSAEVKAMAERTIKEFGKIDILLRRGRGRRQAGGQDKCEGGHRPAGRRCS